MELVDARAEAEEKLRDRERESAEADKKLADLLREVAVLRKSTGVILGTMKLFLWRMRRTSTLQIRV